MSAFLATACGNNNIDLGTPVMTLTDTSGAFTSYIVTIDTIILTRKDGTVAEPLSLAERVDLTKLADVVELLEAPAAQTGSYVTATITFDYSTASITVNQNGQSVPVVLQDITGVVPTAQTLTVQFDPNHPLVINKGQSSLAAMDFDLEASNSINFSTNPVTVTVKPVMTINAAPIYDRPIRARGLFVDANVNAGTFSLNLRPLNDLQSALGALHVTPTPTAYYNVNGVVYTGAAGLAAVAKLQENAQIQVVGTPNAITDLSTITPVFSATAIYAGTSLESTIADNLQGVVAARSGNQLTLRSAELVDRLGQVTFADSVTVTVGPATIVNQDGVVPATPLDTSAISVGQFIRVAGQSTVDAAGNPVSMDATGKSGTVQPGQVRLQPTTLWGTLNSVVPGSLSATLLSIADLEPNEFYFTGTGTNSGLDATPASYAVNTGSIDASQNAAGTLVKIDGFASPFGLAPPDFNATAVTPGTVADSELIVEWDNGGTKAPFAVSNADGIIIDLTNQGLAGTLHVIRTGPTNVDIGTLPGMVISTSAASVNQAGIVMGLGNLADGILTVNDSQSFANAITGALNAGQAVNKLVAVGHYDPTVNTFNATKININIQ